MPAFNAYYFAESFKIKEDSNRSDHILYFNNIFAMLCNHHSMNRFNVEIAIHIFLHMKSVL